MVKARASDSSSGGTAAAMAKKKVGLYIKKRGKVSEATKDKKGMIKALTSLKDEGGALQGP